MSDTVKYSQSRLIGEREMTERPGRPSQILREAEASLIGEVARAVALSDKQFVGWPRLELANHSAPWGAWELRATVEAR